jgi:hypothetical protein
MVYIPFAYLLSLQAALNPFASKLEPEPELVPAPADLPFVNPTIGGGSLLDKDSSGGEPLNVNHFVTCRADHLPS